MPRDWLLHVDDILGSADRIRVYTRGLDLESFAKDPKTQDAVIRNLEVIGEAARALPDDVRARTPDIAWRKIVALRNILIHEYFGVDIRLIWDVVENQLPVLEAACLQLRKSAGS